jgi:hypothetical protein
MTIDSDEDEPLNVSLKRASKLLGLSIRTLYRMEEENQIIFKRRRGRTLVPMSEIKRVDEGRPMLDAVGEPVGEPPKPRVKKIQLYPQVT